MKHHRFTIEVESTTTADGETDLGTVLRFLVNGEPVGMIRRLQFDSGPHDRTNPGCEVVLPKCEGIAVDDPDFEASMRDARDLNARTAKIVALLKPFSWIHVRYTYLKASEIGKQHER